MRRVAIVVFMLIISISILFFVDAVSNNVFDKVPPLEKNELFCVLSTEIIPRSNAVTFLIADNYLVLFYEEHGLINFYDLDGTFQYGIRIETIQNGNGDIAHEGEIVYVESRSNRMYVISNINEIYCFLASEHSIEYQRIKSLMNGIPNHASGNVTFYYVSESNSIVKTDGGGPLETVLELPKIDRSSTVVAIWLLLMIALSSHVHKYDMKTGG